MECVAGCEGINCLDGTGRDVAEHPGFASDEERVTFAQCDGDEVGTLAGHHRGDDA